MIMKRRSWTEEEDRKLQYQVSVHGAGNWDALARAAGIQRSGSSCRHRWVNYLSPQVRRGNITDQEMLVILNRRYELGNKWSQIAQELPGRTTNDIKNFWNTRVKKEAKKVGLEVESLEFLLQMIEKIQGAAVAVVPSMNPSAELALPLLAAATGGDGVSVTPLTATAIGGGGVAASSLTATVENPNFSYNSGDFQFVDRESSMYPGAERALNTLPPPAATYGGGVGNLASINYSAYAGLSDLDFAWNADETPSSGNW